MHTPRKAIYAEAMSPQRFAQEAVLRALEVILASVLRNNVIPEITEEYADFIAKQSVLIGHMTAEQYSTPRIPE